jgi:hypothetical protein
MPLAIASPTPLNAPMGWSNPAIARAASVVGWPSSSKAQPSGIARPFWW